MVDFVGRGFCSAYIAAMPQYMSRSRRETFFSLVYCGSSTAAIAVIYAEALKSLSSTVARLLRHLVYCDASEVGVEAPQFESFYMVPFYCSPQM